MIVSAYKCPFTGVLFDLAAEEEYNAHVKKHKAIFREQKRYEKIKAEYADWFASEKEKIATIEEIAPWFLENQRTIMDGMNAIHNLSKQDRERFQTDDIFTKLEIKFREFDPLVSNTHVCPRNGGVTNWWCKNDKPRGYPGWEGQVSGTLVRPLRYNSSYPSSSILNFVDIHTGSGGGGNKDWSYGVSVFLDDWSGIQETIIVEKLKGIK